MIRQAAFLIALAATPVAAQQVTSGTSGELRVLDKTTAQAVDLTMAVGETKAVGLLSITLGDCRYPTDNPAGNAYAEMTIFYRGGADPVFQGWMIASAPALNAMEHPRYDVWVLRCMTS